MTVTATDRVTIDVGGCSRAHCLEWGWRLKKQLDPGYCRGAAVMQLEDSFHVYRAARRTARKRADRAARVGYRFGEIDRPDYIDDIHRINTSKAERQGRPMTAGYMDRPAYGPNPQVCAFHHIYTYGVTLDEQLVAYLWLYRCGELALVSSILGHADHEPAGVMYLLFLGTVEEQYPLGGTIFYNLWASGQDGLRFFKTRLGLTARDVEWVLR